MQNLLITGGSGYIGSHTLLELARTGKYNLTVFDNLKNGHKESIEIIKNETGQGIKLVVGDLLNQTDLEKLFSENTFDGVIHFAALIEAGVSMVEPAKFFENNITGSINLIRQMQKHNVRKIVFSSTAAVYKSNEDGLGVTEESPAEPENWYGYTKLVVENLLRSVSSSTVSAEERIDSIILRYFNAAGANPEMLIGQDYPKPTHLMTVAIEAALGIREKLVIFGNDYPTTDGTCVRSYIHVQDLANAHVKALDFLEDFRGSDFFNVAPEDGYSVMEIISELEKIHGKFNYEFGPRRPGDPAIVKVANNSKIRKILGWEPKFGIEEIVKHAYEWKKQNPNGFQKM